MFYNRNILSKDNVQSRNDYETAKAIYNNDDTQREFPKKYFPVMK